MALPDIGRAFDASQTELNLVAVSYSLGLAASVLYLGAVGDRYGRKMMLILGVVLSVPACLIAAWASSVEVLIGARLLGGLSAGMAYPTTLALITALWSGPARTKSIALWSGTGGAIAVARPAHRRRAARPLLVGFGVPRHAAARGRRPDRRGRRSCPATSTRPPTRSTTSAACSRWCSSPASCSPSTSPRSQTRARVVAGLAAVAVAAGIAFVIRQRRARVPLYDLHVAGRRIFWVAACAGIIVFGTLMGAMFIGQQFLQNVLAYSTFEAGAAILPAALLMVLIAPRSAKLVEASGARFTLLVGYVFCLVGFVVMLTLWEEGIGYWAVGLGYALVGAGVGFAGTPASHSLTGSVPVTRAGMASGTADLQRDLGGAIMQSILGAVLTAGYAAAIGAAIAASPTPGPGHRQRPGRAAEVVRQRGEHRPAVPAVRRPDHRRGDDLVPRRRRLGVPRGHRRDRGRGDPGLLLLPPQAGCRTPPRPVPRRGHRRGPGRGDALGRRDRQRSPC